MPFHKHPYDAAPLTKRKHTPGYRRGLPFGRSVPVFLCPNRKAVIAISASRKLRVAAALQPMFAQDEIDAARRIQRTETEPLTAVYPAPDDCDKWPDLWANVRYREDALTLARGVIDMATFEGE